MFHFLYRHSHKPLLDKLPPSLSVRHLIISPDRTLPGNFGSYPFSQHTYSQPQRNGKLTTNASPPLLMSLPPELLLLIASFLPKAYNASPRSPTPPSASSELELAHSDLTALASTCSALRTFLFPLLFSNISVHSSTRLISLSKAPLSIHSLIRNLTVELDLDFYESWIWSLEHREKKTLHPPSAQAKRRQRQSDLRFALATILLQSSSDLRKFSFVMKTRSTLSMSPWSQFPRPNMASLPFAEQVVNAMRTLHSEGPNSLEPLSLPTLVELKLDATADISSLLSISPQLTSLRLRIPDGFNSSDCKRIVESLKPVSKLRRLEMWVYELVSNDDEVDSREERIRLIGSIGKSCPKLEWLNFQTRSFDYADGGMGLRVVGERGFDWKDILPTLPYFPCLAHLQLPGSLYKSEELREFVLDRHHVHEPKPDETDRYSTIATPPGSRTHSRSSSFELVRNLFSSSTPTPPTPPPSAGLQPPPPIHRCPSQTLKMDLVNEKIQTRERDMSALIFKSSHGPLEKVGWVRESGDLVGVEFELTGIDSDGNEVVTPTTSVSSESSEYKPYLFDPECWEEELAYCTRLSEFHSSSQPPQSSFLKRVIKSTLESQPPSYTYTTSDSQVDSSKLRTLVLSGTEGAIYVLLVSALAYSGYLATGTVSSLI